MRRYIWLAGVVLLCGTATSPAQVQTGATGGTGAGGGVGGAGGAFGGAGGGAGGAAGMSGGNAFSGGQALQGGLGALGQTGGQSSGSLTGQLTPGGAGSGVGSTTFMGPYFVNPLSLGIRSAANNSGSSGGMNATKPTFGVPLYQNTATGTTGPTAQGRTQGTGATGTTTRVGQRSTTGVGGRAGQGVAGGVGGGLQGGFGGQSGFGGGAGVTDGVRAQGYTTVVTFATPALTPVRVQTDLQGIISRSSSLASRDRIQALIDGETVVLRGTVATEQERRLAEAVARLTPGVYSLRNELEVQERPPPQP